jgi:hypothetical protein
MFVRPVLKNYLFSLIIWGGVSVGFAWVVGAPMRPAALVAVIGAMAGAVVVAASLLYGVFRRRKPGR